MPLCSLTFPLYRFSPQPVGPAESECPIPLPKKRQSYALSPPPKQTSDLFSPSTFAELSGPLFDEFQRNQNGVLPPDSSAQDRSKYAYDRVSPYSPDEADSFRSSGDFDTLSITDSEGTLTPRTPRAADFVFPSSPLSSSFMSPDSPFYDPVPPHVSPAPHGQLAGFPDNSPNPLVEKNMPNHQETKAGEPCNFDCSNLDNSRQNNSFQDLPSKNVDAFFGGEDTYETLSVTKSISSQFQSSSSISVMTTGSTIQEKTTSFAFSESRTVVEAQGTTPPKPLPRNFTLGRSSLSRSTSDSSDIRTPPVAKPRRSLYFGSSSSAPHPRSPRSYAPAASSPRPVLPNPASPPAVPPKVSSPPAAVNTAPSPPAVPPKTQSPPAVANTAAPAVHPKPPRNNAVSSKSSLPESTPPPKPKPYVSKSVGNFPSSSTSNSPLAKRKSRFLPGAIRLPFLGSGEEPNT